jgi:hypothetical protein
MNPSQSFINKMPSHCTSNRALKKNLLININNRIEKHYSKLTGPGLFYGQMGLVLYLYNLSCESEYAQFEALADKILDEILAGITDKSPVDFADGLSGIGLGINYLISRKFVEGNPMEILKEIDDKIFREINFNSIFENEAKIESLIGIAFYLSLRLKDCNSNDDFTHLFKDLLINIINNISETVASNTILLKEPGVFDIRWLFPHLLSLLGQILSAGIYTQKTKLFIKELTPYIISNYPVLDANKLHLLYGISRLSEFLGSKELLMHRSLLKQAIHIPAIIENEFKDKAINVRYGLTGFYFLIDRLQKMDFAFKDTGAEQLIFDRIVHSSLWDSLDFKGDTVINLSLLEGLSGIAWGLTHMTKKFVDKDSNPGR